jgi:hypothetical protein
MAEPPPLVHAEVQGSRPEPRKKLPAVRSVLDRPFTGELGQFSNYAVAV